MTSQWELSGRKAEYERRKRLSKENGGVYPGYIRHGSSAYSNYACRCVVCRTEHVKDATDRREFRRRMTAANGGVAPVEKHNYSTYTNWGCSCSVCRADHTAKSRKWKEQRRAEA